MKRLIVTFVTVLSMAGLSASALAAGFWKATISSPANTTSKTFNVQYTTSSTDPDDDFTVELFQNNVSVGTQTTIKPNGDSGVFQVTVPANGTYSYFIKAIDSNDATPKTTGTVSVAVTDPPAGTVTTVTVSNPTNTATTANTTATAAGQGGGAATTGGTVAGAATGEVGNRAATTTTTPTADNGSVLGSETKKDTPSTQSPINNKTNPLWYVLGIGGLAAIGYGAYIMRIRNNSGS